MVDNSILKTIGPNLSHILGYGGAPRRFLLTLYIFFNSTILR